MGYFVAFSSFLFMFSLWSLIFISFTTVFLGLFLLGLILYGTLCFLDFANCLVSHIREVFCYCLLKYVLGPFSPPSGTPVMLLVVYLTESQKSLKLSFFLLVLFSSFSSIAVVSSTLASSLLIHSSASFILLLSLSHVFSFQLLYSSSFWLFLVYPDSL